MILKNILNDIDPMPNFGMKLISLLLDKNIQFVGKLKKIKLVQQIIDNYSGTYLLLIF